MARGVLLGLVFGCSCLQPNPAFDSSTFGSGATSSTTEANMVTGSMTGSLSATDSPTTSSGSSAPGTSGSTGACDGCVCTPGAHEACYSGPPGTEGVGVCAAGQRTCENTGTWGLCQGEVLPATEVCSNGADEDCNAAADDAPACSVDPECPTLPGLLACYPFPPEVVDQVRDGSGKAHHGTMSGVSLVPSATGHDKAGKFILASLAHVAEHPDLSPDLFTVVMLTRPINAATGALVDKDNQFGLFLTDGNLSCLVVNDQLNVQSVVLPLPSDVWSFVACSFDGSSVTLRRFSGGSTSSKSIMLDGTLAPPNNEGLQIGNDSGGQMMPFVGGIDWVLLFDHALSESDLCMLAGPLCV